MAVAGMYADPALIPLGLCKTSLRFFEDSECLSRCTSIAKRTLKAVKQLHEIGSIVLTHEKVVVITELLTKLSHACDIFLILRLLQDTNKFFYASIRLVDKYEENGGITVLQSYQHFLRFIKTFSLYTKVAFIFQKMKFFKMGKTTEKICIASYPIIKIVINLSDLVKAWEVWEKVNRGVLEEADSSDHTTGPRLEKPRRTPLRDEEAPSCHSAQRQPHVRGPDTPKQKLQKFVIWVYSAKVITSLAVGIFSLIALIAGMQQAAINLAFVAIAIDLAAYANHFISLYFRSHQIYYPDLKLPGIEG